MRFQIHLSKIANKFFFISNLTEWHFSCRPEYNKKWLEILGSLEKKEKKYLSTFKKILQKYGFATYLGKIFISQSNEKQIWQKLKKILTKKEINIIKKTFALFNKKFNKIWLLAEKTQKQNIKIIDQELKSQTTKDILSDIAMFFGQKPNGLINIYLIANPMEHYFAGGANLDENSLTVEIGQITAKSSSSEKTIRTTFHEFLHLFLNKHWVQEIIMAELKKQKIKNIKFLNNQALTEEMLICSIFPDGYLAEKYFHFKVNNKRVEIKKQKNDQATQKINLSRKIAIQMYGTSKKYFTEKKKADRKYIKKIIGIIKKDEHR